MLRFAKTNVIQAQIKRAEQELKDLTTQKDATQVKLVLSHMNSVLMRDEAVCAILSGLTAEDGDLLGLQIVDHLDTFLQEMRLPVKVVNDSLPAGVEQGEPKSQRRSYVGRTGKSVVPDGTYYMTYGSKQCDLPGNAVAVVKDGEWIIQAGSVMMPITDAENVKRRVEGIRRNAIIENNILQLPFAVNSPSTAASICMGCMKDGWKMWKLEDGRSIEIYRNKE